MFPYRDENETLRTAIVTVVIIALNVLVWIMVQGAGSTMALARSVCNLGLIPGELTGSLPVGTSFPIGDGLVCATDPGRQIRASGNLDVPAWFVDASVGEYVVPVALREQCRGFHGTAALFDLLSALWISGCHGTGPHESRFGDSDGWRVGGDQRGHGRLPGTLSEGTRLRAGIPWILRYFDSSACLDDARLLVAHSVR